MARCGAEHDAQTDLLAAREISRPTLAADPTREGADRCGSALLEDPADLRLPKLRAG
jgi:hypothetical protein